MAENPKKPDKINSEFLSILSHQLRTPLSVINGYISMILEGSYGKIPRKLQRPLNKLNEANQQLNQLVNTLLSISRIKTGKIKLNLAKSSLEKIIKKIVKEFRVVTRRKGLYLKLEIPSPLAQIFLDREKIEQVIINILDNAVKYTDSGGIKIKVTEKKSLNKNNLLIEIADTGAGLDKKEITQIFERFERGNAGERLWTVGTGWGLYIAKKFVELHKGKIWAESQGKNKGSTFYIELPVK